VKVFIEVGDITLTDADCIVNAANPGLGRGSGVCGAIFKATGPELDEHIFSNHPHGCHTGDAVMTPAFGSLLDNGIENIIHAVGPDYRIVNDMELCSTILMQTYSRIMEVALDKKVKSVGLPAISCGVYGVPMEIGARVAIGTIMSYVGIEGIPNVRFVCFSDDDAKIYSGILKEAQDLISEQESGNFV